MSKLAMISAWSNEITEIPDSIGDLRELEELDRYYLAERLSGMVYPK